MSDPTTYRQESRARWGKSARGWAARREQFAQASAPVSERMIELAAPQPGYALLELAAGIGDLGFAALERARPGGTLVTSDFSPEMLSAAQERAKETGVPGDAVRFKQIDAESIDLDAGSLDAVLCRWGYMLMADPETALRETRRTLKPEGRVVLAAWLGPDENLWSALPGRELVRRGHMEAPAPDAPGQFAWRDPDRITETMLAAGLLELDALDRVDFTLTFDDFDHWWATQRDLSSGFAETVDRLGHDELGEVLAAVEAAAEPFTDAETGALSIPAATWVAAATA